MGLVDAIHHGSVMAGDPRRMEGASLSPGGVPALGPWQGNVHIVRQTYGDISYVGRLLPFRRAVVETLSTDAYGFRNPSYREGEAFDAVIIGDCFLEGRDGDLFHKHLERASGMKVYNYNHRRPRDFFSDARFAAKQPRFLIMERIERGFDDHYFQWFMNPGLLPEETLSDWDRIESRVYRWGNVFSHSFFMESLQWGLATFHYRVEKRLPGSVPLIVPALGMLFLAEETTAHSLTVAERGLPAVLDSLSSLDAMCRARNIQLIVLMVPDKFSIYGQWASGREVAENRGDILRPALVSGLAERKIPFVDIMPLYKARSALSDSLLYELDDTRWTPLGKRLAAEEFSRQLSIFTNATGVDDRGPK